jgi:hypothetical protein
MPYKFCKSDKKGEEYFGVRQSKRELKEGSRA